MSRKPAPIPMRKVFGVPAAVSVVSLFGLIAALTGDGVRDVASWIALALPVVAVLWALWRRRS